MNTHLVWGNLVAYSLQIGLLVALAAFVPTLLRFKMPHAKLIYWHVLLAACLLLPGVRPWKQEVPSVSTQVNTNITDLPLPPMPAPSLPKSEIALIVLAAGMLVRLTWLAVAFWRLGRLRRHSLPLHPPTTWSVEADIRISEAISSPVTFGFLHPVVLLPANFPELDRQIQDAILCHEILHVRRRDWLFTLGEELVRSVFWFHPAIWWLLGEIGLAREQEVDRQVVEVTQSRDRYVDALLAIAGARPRLDLAPAPLFLRKRHLKQRVVSIMKEVRMSKTRSFSALAAGLGILAVACWVVTAAFPLAAAPQQDVVDFPGVTVDTGGPVLHRTTVPYPEAARVKNIQGVVTVEATLDGTGNVIETRILNGPNELRRAAQQAVLQWHFAMDSSASTRQVKINFQLPEGQNGPAIMKVAPQLAPGTENDPAKIAAAEDRIKALRSQMTDQLAQLQAAQDPAARQQAAARLSEMQNSANTLQRNLGPAALVGKRVGRIMIAGVSEKVREELMSRLPVRLGDTLAADSFPRISAIVHEFDEHMNVSQSINPGTDDVAIMIFASSGGVTSGVLGGIIVPSGGMTAASVSAASMPGAPKRITIGGNIQQSKLIMQPKPAYPPLAKQARISGVVHLAAIISKDGTVQDLKVIGGHPLLIPSALEAVKMWVYQQTLLNGEPVEVQTQIDVNYTLSDELPPPPGGGE